MSEFSRRERQAQETNVKNEKNVEEDEFEIERQVRTKDKRP